MGEGRDGRQYPRREGHGQDGSRGRIGQALVAAQIGGGEDAIVTQHPFGNRVRGGREFGDILRRLRFAVQNGLSVLVRGRMSLYEPQGQYQLICDSIEPLGAGGRP